MFTKYSLLISIDLLNKDKDARINIKDTLDHAFFVGANATIAQMRKDAIQDGNEMMKFISYSNVDPRAAHELSKKSQGSSSPTSNYNNGSLILPG